MSILLLRRMLLTGLLLSICGVALPGLASLALASPDQGKNLTRLPARTNTAATGPCDRACLTGFVNKYFAAMLTGCPCGVALARDVKYTENGQLVTPGEGIWKTFTGPGTYRLYLADPETGEAGYYGSFTEFHGALKGVMALRLKVKDHQITEVEVILDRQQLRPKGGLGENTAGIMTPVMADELDASGFISPDTPLLAPLSKAGRTPRAEMIAATRKYFQGFAEKNGSIVPFARECSSRENGMPTSNNPDGPAIDPALPGFHVFGGSCSEELGQGYFGGFEQVRDARPLVVDEKQGLVLNLALFDDEGSVKSVAAPGVGSVAVPRNFLRPITLLKPQLFKIEDGKIREIEGLSWPVPYGMPSGWSK